jgi:ribosomal protein S18 acetylase RimI-like enzyme
MTLHRFGLNLRDVVADDDAMLLRIYADTRGDEMALLDWPDAEKDEFLRRQFTAQSVYYRQNYPDARYQMILIDGRPAGRLYVDRSAVEMRIMDIALLPDYRGRGIGGTLMNVLLSEAGMHGIPVRIHVERSNPAMDWYLRLGFSPVEERGLYLLMEWRRENVPPMHADLGERLAETS